MALCRADPAPRKPGLRSLRMLRELVAKGSYELALKEGRGVLEFVSLGHRPGTGGAEQQREVCVDALLELARAYEGLERLPAATAVLEAALEEAQLPLEGGISMYTGGYRGAVLGLAHLYQVLRRYAEAKDMWDQVLQFTAGGIRAEVHVNIARCLLGAGDLGGARDAAQEALQCIPLERGGRSGGDLLVRVLYLNGLAQAKLGQFPEALEHLRRSLSEARDRGEQAHQASALAQMALCQYALGEEAAAAASRGEAAGLLQRSTPSRPG